MAKNDEGDTLKNAGGSVWVGSKMQCKLNLDLYDVTPGPKGTLIQGPRKARVVLNGAAMPRGMDLTGFTPPLMAGGFAITEVPRAHWDEWVKLHKNFPALRSGAIFVVNDQKSAIAKAEETKEILTGHEPIIPDQKRNGVKTFKAEDQEAEAA